MWVGVAMKNKSLTNRGKYGMLILVPQEAADQYGLEMERCVNTLAKFFYVWTYNKYAHLAGEFRIPRIPLELILRVAFAYLEL